VAKVVAVNGFGIELTSFFSLMDVLCDAVPDGGDCG
jgi:hypothetical protein